jgi:hypothetical protein|tara:strand:+ start:6359 stop:7042 length:684 start_codon:yes stop_codon:yes gene_type:complete
MALTYVQLKQAIQDFLENDAAEFTAATGSGVAPIDLCIEFAEMRIFREADISAYRKTIETTLSSNNRFLDIPQDLYVTRYIKILAGEFLQEKDESFVREFTQNVSTQGTPRFYALYGEGAYSASDRGMRWLFSPRADIDYTLEIGYTILPTGLSSSNANSYLGDYAPDLLLYGSLLEAATFMKLTADQGSRYQALYDRALQTFIGQEQTRKRTDEFVSGEMGTYKRG